MFEIFREAAFESTIALERASNDSVLHKRQVLEYHISTYFEQSIVLEPPLDITMATCKDPFLLKQFNDSSLNLDIAIKQFVRENSNTVKSSKLY